jgi:Uma2 family endonuclease
MEALARRFLTEDEYLALEAEAEERHEFVNGEMIAMSGGSHAHSTIAANLARELGNRLRAKDRPCIVMSSDQRVTVDETGLYTYPDLTVVCGQPRSTQKSRTSVTNPIVLVEILSKETEAYDRGAKFAHYRRIPSLQAYVLVSQAPRHIEVFQRMTDGRWVLNEALAGAIEIPGLDVAIELDEVYRYVDLLEPEAG